MIDILYLAKGRPEFTAASFEALLKNTCWTEEVCLVIYTDGLPNDAEALAEELGIDPSLAAWDTRCHGGPVAIMNHYLSQHGAEIFAKIDNDVIVPQNWLEQCLSVMEAHPELDLLGIEPPASRTPAPWHRGPVPEAPEIKWLERSIPPRFDDLQGVGTIRYPSMACHLPPYAPCDSIGGIGFMRRSAFVNREPMKPHGQNGVGGFTDWQLRNADVCKGWIVPPLSLFLLDRLPVEPWASLSKQYIAEGVQRAWTNYPASASHLWEWWLKR